MAILSRKLEASVLDALINGLIAAAPLRMQVFRGPYDLLGEAPCELLGSHLVAADVHFTGTVRRVVVVGNGQGLVSMSWDPAVSLLIGESIDLSVEVMLHGGGPDADA